MTSGTWRARDQARTDRALRVLREIAEGGTVAETATALKISKPTVDRYLLIARQELGARTTAQAVAIATRLFKI